MSEIPLGVFPSAKCALRAFTTTTCEVPWEKWCSGCNLVFCGFHAKPESHECRSLREKPPEVIAPTGNGQKPPSDSGPAPVLKPKTTRKKT